MTYGLGYPRYPFSGKDPNIIWLPFPKKRAPTNSWMVAKWLKLHELDPSPPGTPLQANGEWQHGLKPWADWLRNVVRTAETLPSWKPCEGHGWVCLKMAGNFWPFEKDHDWPFASHFLSTQSPGARSVHSTAKMSPAPTIHRQKPKVWGFIFIPWESCQILQTPAGNGWFLGVSDVSEQNPQNFRAKPATYMEFPMPPWSLKGLCPGKHFTVCSPNHCPHSVFFVEKLWLTLSRSIFWGFSYIMDVQWMFCVSVNGGVRQVRVLLNALFPNDGM